MLKYLFFSFFVLVFFFSENFHKSSLVTECHPEVNIININDLIEPPPSRRVGTCHRLWLQLTTTASKSKWWLSFSLGVALHAAVGRVRDPQSGRLHALLSERTDGQVHAHLPGRQQHSAGVASCLAPQCPATQTDAALGLCVCVSVYGNSVCCSLCGSGRERTVCVLCAHSVLLHERGDHPSPLPQRRLSLSQTSAEGEYDFKTTYPSEGCYYRMSHI